MDKPKTNLISGATLDFITEIGKKLPRNLTVEQMTELKRHEKLEKILSMLGSEETLDQLLALSMRNRPLESVDLNIRVTELERVQDGLGDYNENMLRQDLHDHEVSAFHLADDLEVTEFTNQTEHPFYDLSPDEIAEHPLLENCLTYQHGIMIKRMNMSGEILREVFGKYARMYFWGSIFTDSNGKWCVPELLPYDHCTESLLIHRKIEDVMWLEKQFVQMKQKS